MKFINWLNGKKTAIAAFYNSVTWPAMLILFDNAPDPMLVKANMIIGLMLTFLGVGHKIQKANKN